jgi:CBS domain-containing protein
LDDGGHLAGVITDRDVCMAAWSKDAPLRDICAGDAMSKEVFCCSAGDSIDTVEKLMATHRVRRLPVVDHEHRVVGILSLNDIAREVKRELGEKKRTVTAAALAQTLAAICGHHVQGRAGASS